MSNLRELAKSALDELDLIRDSVEVVDRILDNMEHFVVGKSATNFNMAQNLITTATKALNEAKNYLKDIE